MEDMFSPQLGMGGMNGMNGMNGGFTSLATFSNGSSHHGGGGMGGGNVKRTSTSTSFVNGKKVVTKK